MAGEEIRHREVRYDWKMRDGTSCSMTVFDVTTSEADKAARSCGWPGHSVCFGERWEACVTDDEALTSSSKCS